MQIFDHNLLISNEILPLPKLAKSATVKVWSVPTNYRATGYYVDTTPQGEIPSYPACNNPTYLGELTLEAHPDAIFNAVKAERIKHLNDTAEAMMEEYTSDYGFHTKLSWTDQKNEAYGYLNDPTTETPTLTEIATGRGISVEDLVIKVIAKAERYRKVSGAIMGECQRCEDLLEAMTPENSTIDQLMMVEFNKDAMNVV